MLSHTGNTEIASLLHLWQGWRGDVVAGAGDCEVVLIILASWHLRANKHRIGPYKD